MSRSFRNNNPGNIRSGVFSRLAGSKGKDPAGFAKFPTAVQGTAALARLLAGGSYRGLSILNAMKRYAPAQDRNDPDKYARYVAQAVGVSVHTFIDSLDPYQFLKMIQAITSFEGWKE
jgi:hypothetical protein